jgi:hypothetical protein
MLIAEKAIANLGYFLAKQAMHFGNHLLLDK